MKTIIIIAILFTIYKLITSVKAHRAEQERQEAEYRRETDNARMRQEWREMQEKARQDVLTRQAEFREQERQRKLAELDREALWKEQDRLWKEQERQAKEQTRLAKEQERQAAQLERHEEMLMKLDHRLASAESEIAFNREQIERIFKLQEFEISARDACSYGSADWQKHEKKVISFENQIHTIQKRIDKAKADKRFCESKLA